MLERAIQFRRAQLPTAAGSAFRESPTLHISSSQLELVVITYHSEIYYHMGVHHPHQDLDNTGWVCDWTNSLIHQHGEA